MTRERALPHRHRRGARGAPSRRPAWPSSAASWSCCPPTPSTASAPTPSTPTAVRGLLEAKGRGREMPPPVLVSAATTLDALATGVPGYARALVEAFWPGPLTLVCHQQASLQWDLGDTRGTVAVRMPDHEVAPRDPRAHRPAGGQLGQPDRQPGRHRRRRRPSEMLGERRRGRSSTPAPVARRRGLDDRRRHRRPGPGAAPRRALARASSTRCSSRSAPPLDGRGLTRRRCASTSSSSWSPPRSPTC